MRQGPVSTILLLVHATVLAHAAWEVSLPPGYVKTGPVTYIKNGQLPAGYVQTGPAFYQTALNKPGEYRTYLPVKTTLPIKTSKRSEPATFLAAPEAIKSLLTEPKEPRKSLSTAKLVTPSYRELADTVNSETRKILKDKCTVLDSGTVPPASVVLKGINPKGSLGQLMPDRDDIFVHQALNKGSCSAAGGSCVNNNTLMKTGKEFTAKLDWRTCALVGNSGSLLATRYGAAINNHDVVVRMNIAPVAGKEAHVGKKTTMRMINSKWVRLYSQGSNMVGVGPKATLLVRVVDQPRWFSLLHRYMGKRRPDVNVILLNTQSVRAATKLLETYRLCYHYNDRKFEGGTIPSSGFVLALSLSKVCDQVNVYGFGRPKFQGKLVPYQYYIERNVDGSINQGSPNHAFAMEHNILREVARYSPKINICGIEEKDSPECNPTAS